MERRRNLMVGLFALLALAALLGITLIIRGGLRPNAMHVRAEFSQVSGLEVGSPVLVAGVRAGVVSKIVGRRIAPQIVVHMEVARSIAIHYGARARIIQQGFIGDKRIEIDPGPQEAPELPDGEKVEAVEPFDLEKTFGEGQQIVTDLRATLATLRELVTDENNKNALVASLKNLSESLEVATRILRDNETNFRETMANVHEASNQFAAISSDFHDLVTRTDNSVGTITDDAHETMATMQSAANDLRDKISDLADTLDARQKTLGLSAERFFEGASSDMGAVSSSMHDAAVSIGSVVAKMDRGEGTLGRLVNDPKPFRDLSEILESLRRAFLSPEGRIYDTRIDYISKKSAQERAAATADLETSASLTAP